jgi:hypothetical protein
VTVPMNGFSRSTVRAPVPSGWFEKHSVTLLAPDGQANVIASREPLDPSIDTERYASVQGELLRKEFPGYREHAFTVVPLSVGPAYLRLFSWTPPDGVAVVQQQVYFARGGAGYTATATAPQHAAERFTALFDEVLRRLEFDTGPPAQAAAPPPFAAPVERPACAVALDLPPDGMPPPLAREVPGAVDRLMVAATDAVDGTRGLLGPGGAARPVDAWDLAVLRQECDRLLGQEGAVERVQRWADAAGAGPTGEPAGLVWTTAARLVDLAAAARDDGAPEAGLAAVLDGVTRHLPEPDAGWAGYASAPARHPRYRLVAKLDPGSGHLLWSGDQRTSARWDYPVDHFDLPIPLALAQEVDRLLRQYDATNPDLAGPAVPSVQSSWNAFLMGYRAVLPQLRSALGPAYAIDDRIAP